MKMINNIELNAYDAMNKNIKIIYLKNWLSNLSEKKIKIKWKGVNNFKIIIIAAK